MKIVKSPRQERPQWIKCSISKLTVKHMQWNDETAIDQMFNIEVNSETQAVER